MQREVLPTEYTREYFRLRVIEDGYKLKWAIDPLRAKFVPAMCWW